MSPGHGGRAELKAPETRESQVGLENQRKEVGEKREGRIKEGEKEKESITISPLINIL